MGVESGNFLNCDFNCGLTNPLSDAAIGRHCCRYNTAELTDI